MTKDEEKGGLTRSLRRRSPPSLNRSRVEVRPKDNLLSDAVERDTSGFDWATSFLLATGAIAAAVTPAASEAAHELVIGTETLDNIEIDLARDEQHVDVQVVAKGLAQAAVENTTIVVQLRLELDPAADDFEETIEQLKALGADTTTEEDGLFTQFYDTAVNVADKLSLILGAVGGGMTIYHAVLKSDKETSENKEGKKTNADSPEPADELELKARKSEAHEDPGAVWAKISKALGEIVKGMKALR
ncbi:hypothetical protein [Roseibium sp. MMSF_3544]|uniref:hypothetical protein n=1 Tax=unclassified Roseibium TaxID=2629323 RepID=UPI00273E62B7|nr:hypothetical protein [Roseibium sp. MMSF_3544]